MVTDKLAHDTQYREFEGLSTDDKPTEDISVNSKFYELDTNDVYYFNGTTWSKCGAE